MSLLPPAKVVRRFADRTAGPFDASSWRNVASAFAASLALHLVALGCLALIVAAPTRGTPRTSDGVPLAAVLMGAIFRSELTPPGTSSESHPPALVAASRAEPPEVPSARVRSTVAPPSSPWSGLPIEVPVPESMLGTSMIDAGVDVRVQRDFPTVGANAERKIRSAFARDPDQPVRFRSDVAIGYPLDALAQGIEGRIVVWFVVDAEGMVIEREAVEGPVELAEWTLGRLDKLVDTPALADRKPVKSWTALEVIFSLDAAREAVSGTETTGRIDGRTALAPNSR